MKRLLICVEAVDLDDRAQGFFVPWLEELSHHNVHATVICLREGRHGVLSHDIISLSPGHGFSAKARRAWMLLSLSWRLRNKYDAVFVRGAPVFVLTAGWLWRLLGKRVLLWYAHYKTSTALRAAVPLSDIIVTSAPEACDIKSRKLHVIGQSIDTERFNIPFGKAFDEKEFLVLGRISEVKRVPEIIRFFRQSDLAKEGYTLKIVGKPFDESADDVRRLSKSTERVFWVEDGVPFDRVPSVLEESAFMVNLYVGSIDKTILEAMAAGVIPIMATNAAEGLLPKHLHWLIARVGDDVVAAMRRLAGMSAESRRVLAEELRQVVIERHSMHSQIASIVNSAFLG